MACILHHEPFYFPSPPLFPSSPILGFLYHLHKNYHHIYFCVSFISTSLENNGMEKLKNDFVNAVMHKPLCCKEVVLHILF